VCVCGCSHVVLCVYVYVACPVDQVWDGGVCSMAMPAPSIASSTPAPQHSTSKLSEAFDSSYLAVGVVLLLLLVMVAGIAAVCISHSQQGIRTRSLPEELFPT